MDLALIIQLLSGAAGGNLAGSMMKDANLGVLGNTIAGILGGGIGSKLLVALGILAAQKAGAGLDIGTIISSVLSGGVSGGVLTAIVGVVRQMLAK